MILFPAIDLKDGKVVRLWKGGFHTVKQVAENPVAVARDFRGAGAKYVHMVDLDGARDGQRKNAAIVAAVTQVGLRVELGGGIRSLPDLQAVFEMGVYRAVLGSAAVSNPELVQAAMAEYGPERVAVGVDAQNGMVKTAGWVENSGEDYLTFAQSMERIGVKHIIFTDIDTDGTLGGPAYEKLAALQDAVSCEITASGGVSCNEDIRRLRDMGLYGAVFGKAYYAGAVDLAQAIKDGGAQC